MSFGKFKEYTGDASKSEDASPRLSSFEASLERNTEKKTRIAQGTKIVGKVYFEGQTEIEGDIEGEVVSKGVLTLAKSSTVKAKITGESVVIAGRVEGDIVVNQKLSLKSPAIVVGNITTPVLTMEEGVVFRGGCCMEIAGES